MMARTALSMGVKLVALALNEAHLAFLKKSLISYIRSAIEGNNAAFSPSDKNDRLEELKPVRLKLWESQKGTTSKRTASQASLPGAGRLAFQSGMEAILDALQSGTPGPPAKKGRTDNIKEKKEDPKTPEPKITPPTPSPSPTPTPAGPAESVADLLKKFT